MIAVSKNWGPWIKQTQISTIEPNNIIPFYTPLQL
jgi:hypothetical protein